MYEEKRLPKNMHEMIHNIILENRKKLSISGVNDVESFDEENIVLVIDESILTIKGQNLHINKISVETGETTIEGVVDSMVYSDSYEGKKSRGFLSKILK